MRAFPPFRSYLRPHQKLSVAALVLLCALTTNCDTAMSASAPLPRTGSRALIATIPDLIADASRRFAVPERWIAEVMQVESQRRAEVVSLKGAIGLMQVMPGTYAALAARYGLGANPWDARDNVLAGAAYLREMYDRYGPIGMLAAYNAGPGRWEDHLSRATTPGRDGPLPRPARSRGQGSRRSVADLRQSRGGSDAPHPVHLRPTQRHSTDRPKRWRAGENRTHHSRQRHSRRTSSRALRATAIRNERAIQPLTKR